MKLCKDCNNFRPHVTICGGEMIHAGKPTCAVVLDPVYGSPEDCQMCRTLSRACGPDGSLFEQRPEGEKHGTLTMWVWKDSNQQPSVIAVDTP